MTPPTSSKVKMIDFTEKHQYLITGDQIQNAVINKVNLLQTNLTKLLDQIEAVPGDMKDCTILIMSLYKENATDSRVLLVKSLAREAARLHSEIEELTISSRNLVGNMSYVLLKEDLIRFGL